MMQEMSIAEVLGAMRRISGFMAPTAADSTVVRAAKSVFRFSAVASLGSVAVVVLTSPDLQLEAS
ncbi:hypothetical protein [Microbacterium wangruii]|uniref:hypothetical protein n=1 Tax=Microbacterium wangruii TaxID=3049073 RepID=UPI00256EFFDD|nr:hypothetical protein [Microbacterium sp. zg-Y1211]MDL5486027.1 hypothetical protein [Microbacterium sp. zg-Y1211]